MMSESESEPLLKVKEDQVSIDFKSSYDATVTSDKESKVMTWDHRSSSSVSERIDPISLSWENINVFVQEKKRRFCARGTEQIQLKQILRDVNGLVKPGTLLAIMGASGAGKSTLLNVLTGRNVSQYIQEGSISVNGVELGRGIKDISAYCQQDEMFFGTLTVREHLQFRALLRMDKNLDKTSRLRKVEDVISEMGLSKCSDTRIGIPGRVRGISGGEMKRLSFASELLTNPLLMFCDEPTSGLDSFMAQSVVQSLQNMANKGRTILCTIHQPSSEVFAMFNQVLLLAEGRVTFMGSSSDAFKFFAKHGYPCPQNFNPADFYVLTLAIVPGRESECHQRVETLCDKFDESDANEALLSEIREIKQREERNPMVLFQDRFENNSSRYSTSWMQQFMTVFWRSWISLFRDVILFRVRVSQTVVIAVILGLIYLRQPYDQSGVMNINGALFILITNASFTNMFAVINTFPIELGIFLREHGSGLYRVDVYYLAKTLAELPTFVFLPWMFVAVIYWMIGFYNDVITFLVCSGVIILVSNVAVSFGYLMSTVSGSVDVALAITPPLLIPFMLFGGLFLNNGTVPVYFLWLKYISWFQYGNEILSVNQWQNVDHLDCNQGNGTSPSINGTGPQTRCFRDGQDVLNYLNFSEDRVVLDLCLLATLLVSFRILAFLVLLLKARLSKS